MRMKRKEIEKEIRNKIFDPLTSLPDIKAYAIDYFNKLDIIKKSKKNTIKKIGEILAYAIVSAISAIFGLLFGS
jgi:hypothetical protein